MAWVRETRVSPFVVAPGYHPRLCEQVTTASRARKLACPNLHPEHCRSSRSASTGSRHLVMSELSGHTPSLKASLIARRGITPAHLQTFPDSQTDIELVVRSLGCHPARACNVVITTTSGFSALGLSARRALFGEFHPSVRSYKHGNSDLPGSRHMVSELLPLPFRSLARLSSPEG